MIQKVYECDIHNFFKYMRLLQYIVECTGVKYQIKNQITDKIPNVGVLVKPF